MTTTPFDQNDTAGLPPLNLLKEAWDRPLRHEDPLLDEERRLQSVAQLVRDSLLSPVVEGPKPIITDDDIMSLVHNSRRFKHDAG